MTREHDRMETEADDEIVYKSFESSYIFENMRPCEIGTWEWQLMFNQVPLHKEIMDAMRDAKEMALEINFPVSVSRGVYFKALPDDFYVSVNQYGASRYTTKKYDFIKALVLSGKYPDLEKIAKDRDYWSHFPIARHVVEEAALHQKWKNECKS